ncbi:methylated-DNA--[protein]-cysteine S-methyltransferase [Anaeromyxobacter diazotrophicus]|uniref:Methylated-DNA--protein-cysteine methyltransferase n=1 Tax=Anaeromyxobacter diazotrophicus TaxID=2590199 RepID=A0A7I9VJI6_9BACT|nr:methylated-DNA--[protein]-cysteine S-methyltransferase [Anaeromyxobacter diazotrophicus]GEJ56290.1 methylated-DNA--protein-cysteine methyltransferase [Anaeromyxobacter diazotrophicus]
MAVRERWMESPIGELRLVAEDGALVAVFMGSPAPAREAAAPGAGEGEGEGEGEERVLQEAARQLAAWFAGERTAFDLPLAPRGTPFQRRVWEALREIPYGETRSYGQIAARLGAPAAVRAVGAANGRNPLSIVVPCHRVIGASGALTGYAGGLERKKWLLGHEREVLARRGPFAGGDQGSLALASRSRP